MKNESRRQTPCLYPLHSDHCSYRPKCPSRNSLGFSFLPHLRESGPVPANASRYTDTRYRPRADVPRSCCRPMSSRRDDIRLFRRVVRLGIGRGTQRLAACRASDNRAQPHCNRLPMGASSPHARVTRIDGADRPRGPGPIPAHTTPAPQRAIRGKSELGAVSYTESEKKSARFPSVNRVQSAVALKASNSPPWPDCPARRDIAERAGVTWRNAHGPYGRTTAPESPQRIGVGTGGAGSVSSCQAGPRMVMQ